MFGYFYEDFDGDLCTSSEMPIGYTLIDLPEEHRTTVYDKIDLIIERDKLKAENETLKHEIKKAKLIMENLFDFKF